MFLFSGYSTQSVMIRENFVLEKLGKLNLQKFPPSKITRYTVLLYTIRTHACTDQFEIVKNSK